MLSLFGRIWGFDTLTDCRLIEPTLLVPDRPAAGSARHRGPALLSFSKPLSFFDTTVATTHSSPQRLGCSRTYERKHGLSTEQSPVSAYAGSSKNLKDPKEGGRAHCKRCVRREPEARTPHSNCTGRPLVFIQQRFRPMDSRLRPPSSPSERTLKLLIPARPPCMNPHGGLQGYLAHKHPPLRRTLQLPYA
jgi:hypothetical protein